MLLPLPQFLVFFTVLTLFFCAFPPGFIDVYAAPVTGRFLVVSDW